MEPQRPDVDELPPDVRAYIEYLEEALDRVRTRGDAERSAPAEPSEAPTTRQVITISRRGLAKRSPRHLYGRQRRGGMGVFDLETEENDRPAFLLEADLEDRLLVLTDRNRFFVLPVAEIAEREVRARGASLAAQISLQAGENLAVITVDGGGSHLHLLSDRGWVRRLSGTQVGHLKPGIQLEVRAGHRAVAACWTSGDDDLFIVTRDGKAIRFNERQVPISGGCLGIRLDPSEEALAIAAVQEESGVVLLGRDGKGTIRLMSGFRSNKSPGAGGKVAMKADQLVGAHGVRTGQDVLAISVLGKIIRFSADEIPAKEGVVQGVNCMSLRADEVVAFTVSGSGEPL